MKQVNLICVECPIGCDLKVTMEKDTVLEVSGNTCPRGKVYAESEVVCPKRVLTTTVRTQDGRVLAVKTDNPVPKSQMSELMKTINGLTAKTPVKIGDVIMQDIVSGVNLIATDYLK